MTAEHEKTVNKVVPFDAKKDLSLGDWAKMMDILKLNIECVDTVDGGLYHVIDLAMAMKIISPDLFEHFNIPQEIWVLTKKTLQKRRANKSWLYFASIATCAISVYSEPWRRMELNLDDDEIWDGVNGQIEHLRNIGHWTALIEEMFYVRMAFPQKDITLDEDAWKNGLRVLRFFYDEKNWEHFGEHAMNLRILAPEKADNLGVDGIAWGNMHLILEEWRKDPYPSGADHLARQAMVMKILAAREVKVHKEGLRIN